MLHGVPSTSHYTPSALDGCRDETMVGTGVGLSTHVCCSQSENSSMEGLGKI